MKTPQTVEELGEFVADSSGFALLQQSMKDREAFDIIAALYMFENLSTSAVFTNFERMAKDELAAQDGHLNG